MRQIFGTRARDILIAAVGGLAISLNAPSAFAVDAKEFQDEFRKNEEAFKRKYIGKPVSVTGTISSISLEPQRHGPGSGPAIGLMNIEKGQRDVVYCYLDDAGKERALSVSKGDDVTIEGTFLRPNVAGLHIDSCGLR